MSQEAIHRFPNQHRERNEEGRETRTGGDERREANRSVQEIGRRTAIGIGSKERRDLLARTEERRETARGGEKAKGPHGGGGRGKSGFETRRGRKNTSGRGSRMTSVSTRNAVPWRVRQRLHLMLLRVMRRVAVRRLWRRSSVVRVVSLVGSWRRRVIAHQLASPELRWAE